MRAFSFLVVFTLAVAPALVGGCGSEGGPKITVNLNVRNLCNYGIIPVEAETRCNIGDDSDCAADEYCWEPDPVGDFSYTRGFCRTCETDANCDMGLSCDHRFCHKPCTTDADCTDQTGTYCTGGFCREAHIDGTQFTISNEGDKDLEVYVDQTELFGNDDACVFHRLEWSPEGQGTVTLAPDDSLYLNVKFTPPETGSFRGFFEIHSNASNIEPLQIFMCGQAVEAPCQESIDGPCPSCTSCTFDDFEQLRENKPKPSCGG